MLESDRKNFVTAIAAMAATFRQEGTEAIYEGYWVGLSDLDWPAVKLAVTRAIRECEFMPSAAELRKKAGAISPADRAIKAWDALNKAVTRYGYYDSVDFDDKLINATVRSMGGWMRLSERYKTDDEKWIRKDFERIYESLMRSGVSAEAIGPLLGFHEQNNRGRYDDHVPTVKMIATGLPPHLPGLLPSVSNTPRQVRQSNAIKLIEQATAAIGVE